MTLDETGWGGQSIQEHIDPKLKALIKLPEPPCDKPHLIGGRCDLCGEYFFPKRVLCPNCLEEDGLEEVLLSVKGSLYTYCIVKAAPLGFSAPYAVGYVDLPEGLRIFSLLTESGKDKLKLGMDLELVIDKIRQDETGQEVYGYKFKPVSSK